MTEHRLIYVYRGSEYRERYGERCRRVGEGEMTKEQLAAMLDGRQYCHEITEDEEDVARKNGLVVVFGGSDDLCEFRGAIDNEFGCWGGTVFHLGASGVFFCGDGIVETKDIEILEHYGVLGEVERKFATSTKIHADYCAESGYLWTFRTDIPHATFDILDGDEKYCRGIVFNWREASKHD